MDPSMAAKVKVCAYRARGRGNQRVIRSSPPTGQAFAEEWLSAHPSTSSNGSNINIAMFVICHVHFELTLVGEVIITV